jgi:cysteine desulfurase
MNNKNKLRIYMDHNATTQPCAEVLDAMIPFYTEIFGNASSVHRFGKEAHKGLDESRDKVAKLINASPEEIIFTSGGSESDNQVIKGVAFGGKGNHIITTNVEHLAVLETCRYLEKKRFEVTYLPVDEYGVVSPEHLEKAIKPETVLVSIMYANNEIGTLQHIGELAAIAKSKGVLFHTDAVQAIGKIPVDVKNLDVDFLSMSAHKIYGPKGIGATYIRKGIKIEPLIHGGHHERNRRAGTENIPGIVGFGKAAELAYLELDSERKRLTELRDILHNEISSKIKKVKLNGHPSFRLPNTLSLSFAYIEGESIVMSLDLEGIAVSTGSACTSGTLEPSHVLSAIKVPVDSIQGSVRFSLGRINTLDDVNYIVKILPPIIERLRKMSPMGE